MTSKNKSIRSFEDLHTWKKARKLRIKISEITKTLPKEEKYRLVDQLLRASRSVTANIAEGYGRFHYQENIQFCRQSKGSLYEIIDHLYSLMDENHCDKPTFDSLKKGYDRMYSIIKWFYFLFKKGKTK